MSEIYSKKELLAIRSEVSTLWWEIVDQPEILTDLSEQNVIFAAGGALVTRFGDENSVIWRNMVEAADSHDVVSVAGINFSLGELEQMGDFYRYLKEEGYGFHCIDERLEGDEEHLDDEVHEQCGACAAVGQATGLENVEDILLKEIGKRAKQQIYEDMPEHESMVILVDLYGADVVLGDVREDLKDAKALPFNVSIPLGDVAYWGIERGGDTELLVSTLVKWNVLIARNIIGGEHNTLQGLADNTMIVVDTRRVEENYLYQWTLETIGRVPHNLTEIIEVD